MCPVAKSTEKETICRVRGLELPGDEGTFEQTPEGNERERHCEQNEEFSRQRNGTCKGPEVGAWCCAPGTVQSSVTGAGDGEGAGKEWKMTQARPGRA